MCADVAEEGAPLVPTAAWGYLRPRRVAYEESELRTWAGKVKAQPWDRAFVFFKHQHEGAAPRMAEHFAQM